MRKFRVAGKTDHPETIARLHALAGVHGDAAATQVRVLRLPAIAMVDYHGVARFAAGHALAVVHAVANRAHTTRRRSKHRDARSVEGAIDDAEIGALVTVVGEEAAAVIARTRARVAVDVVLHDARGAHVARERQRQGRRGPAARRQERERGGREQAASQMTASAIEATAGKCRIHGQFAAMQRRFLCPWRGCGVIRLTRIAFEQRRNTEIEPPKSDYPHR